MQLKDLHAMGERLFSARGSLLSLWQEIGDQFFVERSHFTSTFTGAEDFAAGLMTSYPLLVRRDLGNSFSSMLRPTTQEWFHPGVIDEDFRADNESRRWLEMMGGIQRRAMYDIKARFNRATKIADHDFVTWGQAVIEPRVNLKTQTLLYRTWHLRDVAWGETDDGRTCPVFRKWKVPAYELIQRFGDKVHPDVRKKAAKDPFCEIECRHMVVESDMWDGKEGQRTPYVSVYYDLTHNLHPMEATGSFSKMYVIPRWITYDGSPYAFSPATIAALPEARLLQAMAATLLEAGEKAVNPPMIARQEALRGDLAIYAGGIMWADLEPDQKLEDALRLLTNDKSGIPLGLDLNRDSRALIAEAFFLNKLSLPPPTEKMTAYEVAHRVQEYIRHAMPLFEPVESDYNGALCEETFELMFGPMLRMEARGMSTPLNIPRKLRGADITFRFESPLHDAIEKQKGTKLLEAKQLIAAVLDIYPPAAGMLKAKDALRDALQGTVPAKWLPTEREVEEAENAQRAQQEAQAALQMAQQSADVVNTLGQAAPALEAA